MATLTLSATNSARANPVINRHRVRVTIVATAIFGLIAWLAFHGWQYYRLTLDERPLSPLHSELRSSGYIGVRLGMLGVGMFCILFLYPLRKRWPWLARIGSTRHWLDFHVLMGITAPIIISFHSSFKFQGLAGLAYWIMVTVALSGFVGRYVYAQIPRSLHAHKLNAAELDEQTAKLAADLASQHMLEPSQFLPLLTVPTAAEVRRMGWIELLVLMAVKDVVRPFRIARLRAPFVHGAERLATLGGMLPTHNRELESIVANIRRQSWLLTKIAFLDRTERIFHLWHVIHRPFSLSFIALVLIHISVIVKLGYY